MDVIVCIKQVPDTTEVKINPETNTLVREGVPSIINPFDENAIEEALRLKEKFKEGKIKINPYTCVGGQCKICIKACPTNALYWRTGAVGITEDLCVYCGACVANCMVDDCIKVERKREDGKVEQFSKPRDVIMLQEKNNSQKRFERVRTNAATMRHRFKKEENLKDYRNYRQLYEERENKV